jgi:hypothetical protein
MSIALADIREGWVYIIIQINNSPIKELLIRRGCSDETASTNINLQQLLHLHCLAHLQEQVVLFCI